MKHNDILQVIGSLDSGGIETFVVSVLENISNDFLFDFLVFEQKESFYDDEIEAFSCKKIALLDRKYTKFIRGILKTARFYKLLKNSSYRVVHIHVSKPTGGIIYCVIARLLHRKTIVHGHCSKPMNYPFLTAVVDSFCHYLMGKMQIFQIACSEGAKSYIFGGCSRAIVINNGIDFDKYRFEIENRQEIRAKYSIGDDITVLGSVGRLSHEKNYIFLIELLKNLDTNNVIFLVGDGKDKELLKNKSIEYGVADRIYFIDPTKNVEKYLSAMDIFLMPSLQEGLCNAVIEAQANGMECICSKGIPRIVNYTEKVTFLELNTFAWKQLIEKKHGGKHRESSFNMRCEQFDIKRNALAIKNIYTQLLE